MGAAELVARGQAILPAQPPLLDTNIIYSHSPKTKSITSPSRLVLPSPLQGRLYNIIHPLLNGLHPPARALDSALPTSPRLTTFLPQVRHKRRGMCRINTRKRLRPLNITPKQSQSRPQQAAPTQTRYSPASQAAPPRTRPHQRAPTSRRPHSSSHRPP